MSHSSRAQAISTPSDWSADGRFIAYNDRSSATTADLRGHDLAPDSRFLMLRRTDNDAGGRPHVVLNWFEELQRLVPTK